MAIKKAVADNSLSKQQALFSSGPEEGSLDIVLGLKQLLSRLLKGYDRYLVAAQISRATLKEVSKDTLDKILSSSPDYQPSALVILGICAITGSLEPFKYLLEPLGSDVLDPADKDLIQLARLQEKEREIQSEISRIRAKRGLR